MRKIIFVNLFKGEGGGGEIYLYRLIEYFSSIYSPEQLLLISPNCNVLERVSIRRRFIKGMAKSAGKVMTILGMVNCLFEINKCLKTEKANDIIINGDRAILLSPLLYKSGRIIGIKHMLISSKFKYFLNFIPFCCIDKIVTISNFHVNNYLSFPFSSLYAKKICLIYNAIDTKHFKIDERKNSNDIVFVEIASLERRKGQLDLLCAFKNIYDKNKQIRLFFIGSGGNENEYQAFVNQNGLEKAVHFCGFQSDILPFLSYCQTVFVLPSYEEGLPIVLLEAMSCGLPVISTKIAGIPEVVEHGKNGFLFMPGKVNELINYMEYFIKCPRAIRVMGNEGRQKIVNYFDEEEWKRKWKNVLYQ